MNRDVVFREDTFPFMTDLTQPPKYLFPPYDPEVKTIDNINVTNT